MYSESNFPILALFIRVVTFLQINRYAEIIASGHIMHLASADSEARALILWHGGPFGAMSVKNRSVYRAVQALKVIITQILCLLYAGLTPTFLSEPSNISMYPQQLFLKIIVVFWWQSDPAIILHFLVKKHHIESWAKKYSTFYMIIILSGQWKRIHLDTTYIRCWRDSIIYEQEQARILHDYLLSASQSELATA